MEETLQHCNILNGMGIEGNVSHYKDGTEIRKKPTCRN
jgi:hypothetical protein